jgi:hypothetical protein
MISRTGQYFNKNVGYNLQVGGGGNGGIPSMKGLDGANSYIDVGNGRYTANGGGGGGGANEGAGDGNRGGSGGSAATFARNRITFGNLPSEFRYFNGGIAYATEEGNNGQDTRREIVVEVTTRGGGAGSPGYLNGRGRESSISGYSTLYGGGGVSGSGPKGLFMGVINVEKGGGGSGGYIKNYDFPFDTTKDGPVMYVPPTPGTNGLGGGGGGGGGIGDYRGDTNYPYDGVSAPGASGGSGVIIIKFRSYGTGIL